MELLMLDALRRAKDGWYREFRFQPGRKWRFDLACWPIKLAIELHGGTWSGGRHTRGAGFQRDREKMNAAQVLGWSVLEFTTDDVLQGRAEKTIKAWLEARAK
jgi:very-short-patch-repair endonuclease